MAFIPTSNQKGTAPEIIKQVSASAEDTWTEELLISEDDAINTNLPDDESVDEEKSIIK